MKRYAASILAGAAGCLLMGLPASAQSERLSQADSSLSDTSSVIDQKSFVTT